MTKQTIQPRNILFFTTAVTTAVLIIAGLLAFLTTFPVQAAPTATCTVNVAGGADFTTIATAVADNNCTLIQVASGTYTESVTIDRGLTLQGTGSASTILNSTYNGTYALRLTADFPISISGFTIQNGYNGIWQTGSGDTALTDVKVQHNLAEGILINSSGTISINASTLYSNLKSGIAIYHFDSEVLIENSQIISNSSTTDGGGIHNVGQLTIRNSQILSNTGSHSGGGIYNYPNNSATIFTIEDSIIAHNRVPNGSGGGLFTSSRSTINRVAIFDNYAGFFGGGVYAFNYSGNSVDFNLNNVTLSQNWANVNDAYAGSALLVSQSAGTATLNVKNSTIATNYAAGTTGAALGIADTVITSMMGNIIAANSNANGSANCARSLTTSGYNLEDANSCGFSDGTDLNNTEPLLGPLANNGGNTYTHALLTGSPAIDHFDSEFCADYDQRGFTRPRGAACDSGAFEVAFNVYLPMVLR